MKPTFLKVGVPKSITRAPATVRPPTEAGQATLPGTFECTEIGSGSPPYTVNIAAGNSSDLGILHIAVNNSATVTTPTGWTLLDSFDNGGARTSYVFYRIYDGTETATISVTTSTGCDLLGMAWILSANGTDFSAVTLEIEWATAQGGQMDPPSITPTAGAGTYWVFAGGDANVDYGTGAPTNYSDLGACSVSGSLIGDVNYQLVDITTSEDPSAYADSMSGTRRWFAFTLVVPQTGGDPPVASGDHTHVEADVTDLNHWDATDHDALDHTGLTGVGESDHGALTGLADDDHTQYLLADGTRALSGEWSAGSNKITNVTDPTADQDAATKAYVDANAGGSGELLMQDGVTNPPVPIETEAQDDWLYEG